MGVYFSSDLHLGHAWAARSRGFDLIEEHDEVVINSFNHLSKKDKLFLLGDVCWKRNMIPEIARIPADIVIVMGNHDDNPAGEYLKYVRDVKGAIDYKGWWVTHIPIHPQEMIFHKGNIHGHIHDQGRTPLLPHPYFCANWDVFRGPVSFEMIEGWDVAIKERKEEEESGSD